MYGFTVIYGEDIYKTQLPSCKRSFMVNVAENNFFFFGYDYFKKFENDKIFEENKEYIIGLDGVILNLQKLKNAYGISNYLELIINLYQKHNIDFVSQLKGEFSGFVFDKKSAKVFFFNNKTGTKQVFYSSFEGLCIISPIIEKIVRLKETFKKASYLDVNAVYRMLTFGAVLENQTLIENISKLTAGKFLSLKNANVLEKEYFSFNNIEYSLNSKKQAIEKINEVFVEAIKLEYEKDLEYNYDHLATLSGGLDSRMNVMIAHKLGYHSKTFCFSQSNYLDDIISKKIANSLSLEHDFIPLDAGLYMLDLEENVSINNGMLLFTGAAHYNHSLHQMDLTNYGLMHTGQIGDGIFGGLLTKGKNQNVILKTMSTQFLDKIGVGEELSSKYENEEKFKLYQNVFNLTHAGSYTTEFHKTYLVSPFLDDDLISVALSITPKLKYNQNIYIDWILEKHPEAAKFVWERTGFKPNKKWKTALSRYTKKIKKEYLIHTNKAGKLSMAPENYWMENQKNINVFYSNYFNSHISLLKDNKEVLKDVTRYYLKGNSAQKSIVLTILNIANKFKLKL